MPADVLLIGGCRVDFASNTITRDGTPLRMEPRTMRLLGYLVERAGEVVTRQEIEDSVWTGMVVGYDALTQSVAKLRKAMHDDPRQPRIIETIAKTGYRLIAEIEPCFPAEHRDSAEVPRTIRTGTAPALTGIHRRWLDWRTASLLALILAIAWWWFSTPAPISAARAPLVVPPLAGDPPAIAVLPFVNLGDAAEQEYFVDGLTEDLITDLTKLSGLFVISRNTAFTYKGRAVRLQDVARDLGVRYVLEGSVRRAGNTIRINAQLGDALDDRTLWAERYQRVLDDVFTVQDDIKRRIVAALAVELDAGERELLRTRPTTSIEAYEHYLRGRQAMNLLTRRSLRMAYWALERAIDLDPDFAEALATLALTYAYDYRGTHYWNDWVRPPGRAGILSRQLARQAAELAPHQALPELVLAYASLGDQRYDQALAHVGRAIERQPGNSEVYAMQALVLTAAGQHQAALEAMQRALRLDPIPPARHEQILGMIQFALRDYPAASLSLERAAGRMVAGENWLYSCYLPANYGYLGDEQALQAYFSLRLWCASAFNLNSVRLDPFYQRETDRRHYLEGLRRAGIPEYPYGFQPAAHAERRLDGEALQALLPGHDFQAYNMSNRLAARLRFDHNDHANWQQRHDISDSGPYRVDDNRLCVRFAAITRGHEACYLAYARLDDYGWLGEGENAARHYAYLLVGPDLYFFDPDN